MNVQSLVDMIGETVGVTFRALNDNPDGSFDRKHRLVTASGESLAVDLEPHRIDGEGPGGDFDRTAFAFRSAVLGVLGSLPRDPFTVVLFHNVPIPITTEPAEVDPSDPVKQTWHAQIVFGAVRDDAGAAAATA